MADPALVTDPSMMFREFPGTLILAAGALGTAAFGIAEVLKKFGRIGEAGFRVIPAMLGPLYELLKIAYGENTEALLRAQFRGEQAELTRVIRQGVRLGLFSGEAAKLVDQLKIVSGTAVVSAATLKLPREDLPSEARNVLAQFELAVDARIDAALTLALNRYERTQKFIASLVAIVIAVGVGYWFYGTSRLAEAFLIGLVAVPLAPIAKDVTSAIKAATDALRAKT